MFRVRIGGWWIKNSPSLKLSLLKFQRDTLATEDGVSFFYWKDVNVPFNLLKAIIHSNFLYENPSLTT